MSLLIDFFNYGFNIKSTNYKINNEVLVKGMRDWLASIGGAAHDNSREGHSAPQAPFDRRWIDAMSKTFEEIFKPAGDLKSPPGSGGDFP